MTQSVGKNLHDPKKNKIVQQIELMIHDLNAFEEKMLQFVKEEKAKTNGDWKPEFEKDLIKVIANNLDYVITHINGALKEPLTKGVQMKKGLYERLQIFYKTLNKHGYSVFPTDEYEE